jgi:hypothetical protein
MVSRWFGWVLISYMILQSFSITQEGNMNYLQTLEKDTLNNKIKGIYEWDEFGFALKTMETRYENN